MKGGGSSSIRFQGGEDESAMCFEGRLVGSREGWGMLKRYVGGVVDLGRENRGWLLQNVSMWDALRGIRRSFS